VLQDDELKIRNAGWQITLSSSLGVVDKNVTKYKPLGQYN